MTMRLSTPLIIAFSGGRTSGLMLRMILDHFGGTLPDDVVPIFCNTGKEHDRTLDFVEEVSQRWAVKIRWVEWADAEVPKDRWREVDHKTASRNGEPFAALIRRKQFMPNPVTRFCTSETKINATHRFVKSTLGWENHYDKAIGLRYDEPARVGRGRAAKGDAWELCFPLYDARITVADVSAFWKASPFDLQLPNMNGTTPLGNCDLCFLKGAGKLASIIAAEPHRAIWWAEQERAIGATFRNDRPSYAAMQSQMQLLPEQDDTIDCACTD
jgi:3''-phosphoadenosine 5''-phosphosulfate sulfotransferase (PAPS reductase)/FAD synthetase and related enzymes